MEFSGLNYWAIALSWLISCAVGAFWYSPAAFAKLWEKHTGINLLKLPEQEASRIIGFVALSALFQVLALAVVLRSLDVTTATGGLLAGLVLWAGLVAATTVGVTLYSRRSWGFWWLNSSYFLLVMGINSIILAVWR